MRHVLLSLAVLGVLCVGAAPAYSQQVVVPTTPAAVQAIVPDQTVITPVRWAYGYPGWGGYYAPYTTYYGPTYGYPYRPYVYPYRRDYYPGFGFYYGGPRRAFGFGW